MKTSFDLTPQHRSQLLDLLVQRLEDYYKHTDKLRVTPDLDLEKINQHVRKFELLQPVEGHEALESVLKGMTEYAVHTPHPMYYGLYNPRANFAGIMADLVTAVMNPQLAAWSHSPYANEVEKYLVEFFGVRFGYSKSFIDGVFASGGAEANFTAILCALNNAFPSIGEQGLQGIDHAPVIYCSEEAHHSVIKGARMAGLGAGAVRVIETDQHYQMKADRLNQAIKEDIQLGKKPVMVVATAGTTGTGAIDPLEQIGRVCEEKGLWYHVDAAYGGAMVFDPAVKHWIKGAEMSHSLIVDLHKWFSVPMAASMFITRDPDILYKTFQIKTGYMPGDARNLQITDPFAHSFQWSRRFSGLKIYLSLLIFGVEGYTEIIGEQIYTGGLLRERLTAEGWRISNHTPLPVVCFTDNSLEKEPGFATYICDHIVQSGQAWISVYPLRNMEVLRACITNYNTGVKEIELLVDLLGIAREHYRKEHQSHS